MRIQTFGAQASKFGGAIALCLGLAACGGGSSGTALDGINGGGNSNNGGDGTGSSLVSIGYVEDGTFIPGEIGTNLDGNELAPGGTTILQVNLYRNNRLLGEDTEVIFSSSCFLSGESYFETTVIEAGEAVQVQDNVVTAQNGTASIKYVAGSCTGEDLIEATATDGDGIVVAATGAIPISPDTVNTVTFIGSSPEYISLKGTGGVETSEIVFQVRGNTGAPVKGVEVDFSLNTNAGGISLTQSSDTSDKDGYVSTIVQSGSIPTAVRVSATTENGVTTQSSRVVVSTGLPDQNSISIATELRHPTGWDTNNVYSWITVNVGDAFNNPVPKDTPVYFTTNGGTVEAACLTEQLIDPALSVVDRHPPGVCSVRWRSSDPRPRSDHQVYADESGIFPVLRCDHNGLIAGVETECRNGRAIVMATTIGNESFIDNNANGLFDPNIDKFYTADSTDGNPSARAANCLRPSPISGAESRVYGCDDLGTPYLDRNFNGVHDANEEIANIENDFSSTFEPGNGIYNGALCTQEDHDAGVCSRDSVLVRNTVTLVMNSAQQPFFTTPDGRIPGQPAESPLELETGETVIFYLLLADVNGNGVPATDAMVFNSPQGVSGSISPVSFGSQAEPIILTMQFSTTNPGPGVVSLTARMKADNGRDNAFVERTFASIPFIATAPSSE